MITSDQLKDVLDRADALYKYLKIDETRLLGRPEACRGADEEGEGHQEVD